MPARHGWRKALAALVASWLAAWIGLGPGQRVLAAESAVKPKLPLISVSRARGFFQEPFALKFTAPVDGGLLRYTLDGSEPGPTHGAVYSAPLLVSNTTLLRVAAFKGGARISAITTHTYLVLDQIMRQPKDP